MESAQFPPLCNLWNGEGYRKLARPLATLQLLKGPISSAVVWFTILSRLADDIPRR